MSPGTSVPTRHLRIGLYIHLDLGWMDHPFPVGHFRIASEEQLDTLQGLGLESVRVLPERSAPEAVRELLMLGLLPPEASVGVAPPEASATAPSSPPISVADGGPFAPSRAAPAEQSAKPQATPTAAQEGVVPDERALAEERRLTRRAERGHAEAARSLKRSLELVHAEPHAARQVCERQIEDLLGQFQGDGELAIRLLGETAGDRASLHAVNVTVLSLLLGRQLGLDGPAMQDLGLGALLHDVGKLDLPERVRWMDPQSPHRSVHERKAYEDHVPLGVRLGTSMGLSAAALQVLEQHHECADGSGFPLKLDGARMSVAAHIVALTNRYDQLCNPSVPAAALTPHEALALMYARTQTHFDARVYGAFVRMMGVYPPGSVVELSDGRHAMVACANVARPLRPRLLVHEPAARSGAARVVDLQDHPQIGIRRSLKPQQLPLAALEGLSPRARVCYFFEPATEPVARAAGAAR